MNNRDLDVAAEKFDILFCSETLVSDLQHISDLLIPGFKKPILLRCHASPSTRGMALYVREGYAASHRPLYECGCHETQAVIVCGQLQNFYVFDSYRSLIWSTIYDYLLSIIAAVQEANAKACYVFVEDFNAHHME